MSRAVRVIEPGLLSTVQDLGRFGYGHLGVSASGAADTLSVRIANRLVGNPDNAPVLEMTLSGGSFEFEGEVPFALAGSDFGASFDDHPAPRYELLHARAGSVLRCGPTQSGARGYLAVAGGFDVVPVLGSASTHLMGNLGGIEGRALKKGDILKLAPAESPVPQRFQPDALKALAPRQRLRVTRGPQWERFGEAALEKFCSTSYVVTEESNRTGLRLTGTKIEPARREDSLTEGVALGAIQIPPGGEPIILFVEQQTTGGYPKIANVISADLPSVGQLRPRDQLTFELVPMAEAIKLLREQEHILEQAGTKA